MLSTIIGLMLTPQPKHGLDVTIAIVAWQNHDGLELCLESVRAQNLNAEVLVVDNGAGLGPRLRPWLDRLGLVHIDMGANVGISRARNAAVERASSPVVCFLDDDAVAEAGWAKNMARCFSDGGVVAVRGRVIPKNARLLNELARAYDLGDRIRPATLNTEGNSAVLRDAFIAVGGFREDMYGHEGAELSARMVARFGSGAVIYCPTAVIRHDYVDNIAGYVKKRFRHGSMLRHLDFRQTRQAAAHSVRRSAWTIRRVALVPVKILGVAAELAGLGLAAVRRQ